MSGRADAATTTCPTCMGSACEEGCGECWNANVGPESHRICYRCRGAGVVPAPEDENGSNREPSR